VKPVSGKRMVRILKHRGWTHTRTDGSHFLFNHPDSALTIAVPVHGNQDLPIGTQKSIMRDAGIKRAEL
jgi:predicted RNA binding protein YcfA (HicA-like mRNA interferase family)